MKKIIALLALLLFLPLFCSTVFASGKVIRVGIGNATPPMCYLQEGKIVGFEHDLWEAIGKKIGAKIEYKSAHYSVLFGYLDNDDVDFIANYFAINPKRLERYNFTEPYAHGFMKLLVLKSNNSVPHGLSDCNGLNVAVTATSNGRMLIEEFNKKNNATVNIMPFDSDEACVQAVEMGQAVGYFTGAGTSVRYIQKGYIDGKFVGPAEQITDTAYPYNKDNPRVEALAREVSKAIRELKQEGAIKAISLTWTGIDITDPSAVDAFK